MRTLLFFLSFLLVQSSVGQSIRNENTSSAHLSMYLNNPSSFDRSQLVMTEINGEVYLSFLVKVSNEMAEEELQQLGGKIGTKAGLVWTLWLPVNQVAKIVELRNLEYIELDRPIGFSMDKARAHANIDSAHGGHQLPLPLSGKDVVVGIIDAGFEYMHPCFYDASGKQTRVKRIWEQKKQGTPPQGFAYGNELKDSNNMRDSATDATFSHGTHVGGIASGSGIGSDSGELKGIAFESELVFVGIRPEKSEWTSTGLASIIDGAKYIYDYAASVNKPAVINLSWGGTIGPNDGTSLYSQALSALTGPGKLFVTSAGNDGGEQMHLFKSFNASDTLIHSFQDFPTEVDGVKLAWIDIWGEPNESFCIQLALWRGSDSSNTTQWYCLDNNDHQFFLVDQRGDTCFVDMTSRKSDFNGKPRMLLNVRSKASEVLAIKISGQRGDVHLWSYLVHHYRGSAGKFRKFPRWGNMEGDDKYCLGLTACAKDAITVAAYSSRPKFVNYRGLSYSLESLGKEGELTSFSSHGPTTDHQIKPNIAAPGMLIASGINQHDDGYKPLGPDDPYLTKKVQFDGEDYWYAYSLGTSMSAPVVTGIIALMLQVKPELTPELAQMILAQTATLDEFTTSTPDSSVWGEGKVNAYAAIKYMIENVSVRDKASPESEIAVYPNPNSGKFIVFSEGMPAGTIIEVVDVKGEMVFQTELKQSELFSSVQLDGSLQSGVYFVRVNMGDKQYLKKMVVAQHLSHR